jgi:hypothetical protein
MEIKFPIALPKTFELPFYARWRQYPGEMFGLICLEESGFYRFPRGFALPADLLADRPAREVA